SYRGACCARADEAVIAAVTSGVESNSLLFMALYLRRYVRLLASRKVYTRLPDQALSSSISQVSQSPVTLHIIRETRPSRLLARASNSSNERDDLWQVAPRNQSFERPLPSLQDVIRLPEAGNVPRRSPPVQVSRA